MIVELIDDLKSKPLISSRRDFEDFLRDNYKLDKSTFDLLDFDDQQRIRK